MMEVKSGVVTEIKAIQLNTLETHCHADSVKLVVKETTRKSSAASYIRYCWGNICFDQVFTKREKQYEKVQKNAEVASFHNAAEVIKQKLLNCMAACLHCLISALRRGSYQLM